MVLTRRLLTAGSGASFQPISNFQLSAAPDGGWSWFGDPRAIQYNGVVYYGFARGTNGDVVVRTYTEATGVTSSAVMLHAGLNRDDHAVPSLFVRDSDHKLLAFYSVHDGPAMYLRVSTNSLDSDPTLSGGFAAEVNLDSSLGGSDYTYPVPIQLLAETDDPIYLFYRSIPAGNPARYDLVYSKSTDGGATWPSPVAVSTINRSYWKIIQNGNDRVDFAVTSSHPFYAVGIIYHFYYSGGSYYQSDGTAMGSPPFATSDMTLVYDGTPNKSWVWDIAIDADGHPVILLATFPSSTDHRYRYAHWNGSAWATNQIVAAGTYIPTAGPEVYYSGGINFDKADPRVVYASVQNGSGRWDMYRYQTADEGATWTSRDLTDSGKNIRPAAVWNAAAVKALWMTGTYTTYTNYNTATTGTRL